jgi:hypothetical protein
MRFTANEHFISRPKHPRQRCPAIRTQILTLNVPQSLPGGNDQNVHGHFLRLDNFSLQTCAIRRHAAQTASIICPFEKWAAQRREKLRKNSLGN